jgi:voltage-gated sodium channel
VSRFEAVVPAAILANSAVLGWGWIDHAHDVAAERIDTCFLVLFLVEFAVRLRRAGWRWLTHPWNLFDAIIILVALLPVVGDGITVLRLARAARLLHLGRHTSHLRVVAWLGAAPVEAAVKRVASLRNLLHNAPLPAGSA